MSESSVVQPDLLNPAQKVLQQYGSTMSNDDLLQLMNPMHDITDANGNITLEGVGNLFIKSAGVPANVQMHATTLDLAYELANGHQVMVEVDSAELQSNSLLNWLKDFFFGTGPDKVMIVAGLDCSDPEHPKVTLSDPTSGDGNMQTVDMDKFVDSWRDSGCSMLATSVPSQQTIKMFEDAGLTELHVPKVHHLDYEDINHAHQACQGQPDMREAWEQKFQHTYDVMNFQLFCAQNEGGMEAIKQYLDDHPIAPDTSIYHMMEAQSPSTHEHYVNGAYFNTSPEVMIGEALGDHSRPSQTPELLASKEAAIKKLANMAGDAGAKAFRAQHEGDIYGAVGWNEVDRNAQEAIHDIINDDYD